MSSYKDLQISFQVNADLLLANKLSPQTAQVLFYNLLLFIKNAAPAFDATEFAQLVMEEEMGNIDSTKVIGVRDIK